jgi:type IV secretory pathway VirB10-like protein
MQDPDPIAPATVPAQPEPVPPLRKGRPVIYILVGIVVLIGLTNLTSLVSGHKKDAPKSALPARPAVPNAQQVSSFEQQQALQARRDQEDRVRQQQLGAGREQQFQGEQTPGPETDAASPMTTAQRAAIYGDSPNGPRQTSNASEAQAERKQRILAREKQHQDALNSDTVAIDFAHPGGSAAQADVKPAAVMGEREQDSSQASGEDIASSTLLQTGNAQRPTSVEPASSPPGSLQGRGEGKSDPMAGYDFDEYQGRLYRVFEGTVLEGVVTNHIDGGFNGPILIMLTTDYYSHDRQQLLMPQGTRLIGTVQSVGSQQERKMFVTFHRAVCPDGFSLDFDKYIGLDPLGTTGLASKVDHGYLMAFGAAAAIGGLGGLAQIGNDASILSPSAQIRNGISEQSAQEGEQVLNHFLNRLPIITLKEGSRARVYIGRDILIPSYAEHRVDSSL